MKKFNEWASNNTNEDLKITGSSASLFKVDPSFRNKTKRFEDIIDTVTSEHDKENPTDDEHQMDLDRRARLIRSIDILHYDNLEKFMKDWNFIKTHAKDEIVDVTKEDDLNVIRNI